MAGVKFSSPGLGDSKFTDWSSLPDDIWNIVLEKLPLEDFIRCQSVCSSWFSIIRDLKRCSSEPRFPWLMIHPENHSQPRRFLDIATGKTHKIHLPEIENKQIFGSSEGWLIVEDPNEDLQLFNPFTRAQIQLPPLEGSYQAYLSISIDSGYIVVIDDGFYESPLWFTRTGETTWTGIEIVEQRQGLWKGAFYKSCFYALDNRGRVLCYDLSHQGGGRIPSVLPFQVPPPLPPSEVVKDIEYLVVLPGGNKLLLVRLSSTPCEGKMVDAFSLEKEEAVKLMNLDGRSLFITEGTCGSSYNITNHALAKDLMKENCVCIADEEVKSLIIFDIESRCTKSTMCLGASQRWGQPVWVNPIIVRL